jgi:hypothetical protein
MGFGRFHFEDLIRAQPPHPLDRHILAEISGTVSFGKPTKDKIQLLITNKTGDVATVMIHKWSSIFVLSGELVMKGEVVAGVQTSLHDVINTLGEEKFIEVIYKILSPLFGYYISHPVDFEVLIRAMISKVIIRHSGDSHYTEGETLNYSEIIEANKKLSSNNKEVVKFKRLFQGVDYSSDYVVTREMEHMLFKWNLPFSSQHSENRVFKDMLRRDLSSHLAYAAIHGSSNVLNGVFKKSGWTFS